MHLPPADFVTLNRSAGIPPGDQMRQGGTDVGGLELYFDKSTIVNYKFDSSLPGLNDNL
jgi:hypothetical protein